VIYETFAIFGSIVFLLFFERGLNAIIVELTIIYHLNVLRVFQFLYSKIKRSLKQGD